MSSPKVDVTDRWRDVFVRISRHSIIGDSYICTVCDAVYNNEKTAYHCCADKKRAMIFRTKDDVLQ